MNRFTITAYSRTDDVATVTLTLDPRGSYQGGTITGIKLSGIPKDTVLNVKAFMRDIIRAYVDGRISELDKQVDISNEVKDLLNVATEV